MHSGNLTIHDLDLYDTNAMGPSPFQHDQDKLIISFCCMENAALESGEVVIETSIETPKARPPITLPSSAPFILLKVICIACFIKLHLPPMFLCNIQ